MFGRPQGMLGRLGGIILARTNEACGAWVNANHPEREFTIR